MDHMDGQLTVQRLARAARPNLFDAAAHPEVMIALIYANLMSPLLWDLKRRIHQGPGHEPPGIEVSLADPVMARIHDYVNRHFYHVSPWEVSGNRGLLDIEAERRDLGAEPVDRTIDQLKAGLKRLQATGQKHSNQYLLGLIEDGKFPDYEYSAIDVLEAQGRLIKRKHRPLGVSACADEAAVISALACVEGGAPLDQVIILGSPVHYLTLISHDNRGFLFNGKREFHTADTWARMVEIDFNGDYKAAFESRVIGFDRVITAEGVFLPEAGQSTMPRTCLEAALDRLAAFFGPLPEQVIKAQKKCIDYHRTHEGSLAGDISGFADSNEAEGTIMELARRHPGSMFEMAGYAYRSLSVQRPEAYLLAGLKGGLVRQRAAEAGNLADALAAVDSIEGHESIMHGRDRIALPDEVIVFNTADHREKALYLWCLLRLAGFTGPEQKRRLALAIASDDSYVRIDDGFIGLNELASVAAPAEVAMILRLDDYGDRQ